MSDYFYNLAVVVGYAVSLGGFVLAGVGIADITEGHQLRGTLLTVVGALLFLNTFAMAASDVAVRSA